MSAVIECPKARIVNSTPLEGREAVERFYDLITRGSGASFHWRLIPRKGVGGPIHEPIFPLARFFERGHDKCQHEGYNIYAVINGGGGKDAHIDEVRAFFIDGDDVPLPESWHVEPHFICVRDDRHWHAFWLAADGVTPAKFIETQKRLAKQYDNDKVVFNPSRIMRVPGFVYAKDPANPALWVPKIHAALRR